MKLFNKRGAALLQVLLVAAVLAGMATMLLRVSFSRASMSRRTHRAVSAQLLIDNCQAEVNALWAAKNTEHFVRDLQSCYMTCRTVGSNGTCTQGSREHGCEYTIPLANGQNRVYTVKAKFTSTEADGEGYCPIEYELATANGAGSEVPL